MNGTGMANTMGSISVGMSATFQGVNPVAHERDRNGKYQGVNIRRNVSHIRGSIPLPMNGTEMSGLF